MPLKKGSSKEVISANIKHCMDNYRKTGKVSGNPVVSDTKAAKICAAMAYSSAESNANSEALGEAISKRRK